METDTSGRPGLPTAAGRTPDWKRTQDALPCPGGVCELRSATVVDFHPIKVMIVPNSNRRERLGLDGVLFKLAVRNLEWARRDDAGDTAAAERLGLSVSDMQMFCRLLIKSGQLTKDEVELFRRVASVRRSDKDAPARGPAAERRDIIPQRSNDVVYVTTSGRAGVFHLRPDCPLLHRGQTAAATMGKEVWPVEGIRQPDAEHDGRDPCTFCIPALGAGELLGRPVLKGTAVQQTSSGRRGGEPAHSQRPESKNQAKRERDRAEADRLGITVPELKARRRAENEAAARRGRT